MPRPAMRREVYAAFRVCPCGCRYIYRELEGGVAINPDCPQCHRPEHRQTTLKTYPR